MNRKIIIAALALAGLGASYWFWVSKAPKAKTSVQFTEKTPPPDALFELLKPADTGVDFANQIEETHGKNILADSYLYNGGGVAIIDVNNDGKQDLFFVGTQLDCKLYLNEGSLRFKDITQAAGVASPGGSKTGVAVVDVNADGWQDIYLCRTGLNVVEGRRNQLFVNNKDNTFTDQAKAYGLDDVAASNHANFFDADNDGDLDCYVLNYPVDFSKVNSVRVKMDENGKQVRQTGPNNPNESDHLFRNNGNGTFSDISQQAGIWNRAMGLSVTVSDLNNDGLRDIFIGNDYIEPDYAYLNNPSKPGTFTDANATMFRHAANHTMGVDIVDLNGDGLNDLVALDMLADNYTRQKELMSTMIHDRYQTLVQLGYGRQQMRNVMQINNGNGTFSEVGCLAGIFQTDWSWATLAQDFDNDGLRDLFITNGCRRDVSNLDYLSFTYDSIMRTGGVTPQRFPNLEDYLKLIPSVPLQNYCYRALGDLRYEDVSTAWGLTQLSFANGSAYADLDNDGDLELVINNLGQSASIYKNRSREQNKGGNWLQLQLKGDAPNTLAVGARARVQAGGKVQYAELTPIRGFYSSVEHLLHFGLGDAAVIERLEVEFPNGQLVVKEQVPPNQRLVIQASEGQPGRLTPPTTAGAALVSPVPMPDFTHTDDPLNGFEKERLLPWEVSNLGPCVAVGDVNNDGMDDCYVGNGPNGAGGMFLQTPAGLRPTSQATFAAHASYEDGACHFFDANKDGHLDLLVATGGNQVLPADKFPYLTRLYVNDGKGNFTYDAPGFPGQVQVSSNALATLDIDGDGDEEVLLCGTVTPGRYPEAPRSYVLKNETSGGLAGFMEATDKLAPAFAQLGMVRDIVVADLNNDNQKEVIVASEWQPIQVFTLSGGQLIPATEQFGLQSTNGIWRSISTADVDGDGDQDLLAGNLGLNTRYKATAAAPLRIFYKDFDHNGSMDPIMTYTEDGKDVPLAMRDVLLKHLPPLKKKMVRYINYATMTLQDLFVENDLKDAKQVQCNTLASTVFINDNGKFTAKPLPSWAQVSPLYALRAIDVDSDGDLDLLGAGNEQGQQVETGPLDAGNGVVLLNDGQANFSAMPPLASGFWATQEARDVQILKSKAGKPFVVVANNKGKLQGYRLR